MIMNGCKGEKWFAMSLKAQWSLKIVESGVVDFSTCTDTSYSGDYDPTKVGGSHYSLPIAEDNQTGGTVTMRYLCTNPPPG